MSDKDIYIYIYSFKIYTLLYKGKKEIWVFGCTNKKIVRI